MVLRLCSLYGGVRRRHESGQSVKFQNDSFNTASYRELKTQILRPAALKPHIYADVEIVVEVVRDLEETKSKKMAL